MGILDTGLFGLGGLGGSQPPAASLLGGMYDPAQLRKIQLKNMLLGAGIGLLNQGPSDTPISFGSTLGKGLAGGLTAAQAAQGDYMNSAMQAAQLKRQQEQDARAQQQADQNNQMFGYQLQEAQRKASNQAAFEKYVGGLSPEEQVMWRSDPQAAAQQYFKDKYAATGSDKYFGTPLPFTNPDGSVGYALPSKAGEVKPLSLEGGAKFMSPYDKAYQKSQGSETGKIIGEAAGNIPGAQAGADYVSGNIDALLADPKLSDVTGWNSYRPDWLSTNDMIGVRSKLDQIRGQGWLEARQAMKGGGSITDYEGKRAEAAQAAIDRAIQSGDVQTLKIALMDLKGAINNGMAKLRANAKGSVVDPTQAQPIPQPIPQGGDQGGVIRYDAEGKRIQ